MNEQSREQQLVSAARDGDMDAFEALVHLDVLNRKAGHYFVLNQSDNRRQVSRDVTAFMEQKLGNQLLGVIHRDESVIEANASQQSVFDFSPASAAAFDIELIAKRVAGILGVKIGDGTVHSKPKMSGF